MGRCGVSKPNRRLQSRLVGVVSLVQWIGPHRTANQLAKPNRTIGRAIRERESHIPEWLLKAKTKKRSIEGVQVKRRGDC